jgi:hypothetical protein
VAAFLLAGFGSNAAPFTNGSFETPAATSAGVRLYPTNQWLTGWSVGGTGNGDVAVVNGTVGGVAPYDGQQYVYFNGGNTLPGGTLSQTFDTTIGSSCTVSFALSKNGTGAVSMTATAIGSNNVQIASNYCVPASQGVWTLFQLNFTAVSTNTTLVFLDSSASPASGVDLAFDDVTVTSTAPVIPPTVVTSPASQTVNAGDSVVLTASASGGASTVQWYLINYQGTNAIAGATSTTLNLTASSTSPGGYFAKFTNSAGGATTSVANLAVLALAFTNGSFEIINHTAIPSGQNAPLYPGDTWLTGWTVGGLGGGNLAVANGPVGVNPYDGQQTILFNGGNTPPGGILFQTFTTTVGYHYTATFAVGQTGSGNMSLTATAVAPDDSLLASNYCVAASGQWKSFQLAFTAVSTNTTLIFKDTSSTTYAVDLIFDDVTVTGGPPAVPPTVVTSPVSQTVNAGDSVVLTASASGGASTVQWYLINYQGTNAIAGATSTTLSLTASNTAPGGYFAVFSNTGGTAATSVANLAVLGLSFTNGSFEAINHAAISSGHNAPLYPGDTWLTGWTVGGLGGGDLAVANGNLGGLNPYDGQQAILFNAGNTPPAGIVSQTFTTTVGYYYTVTFAVGQTSSGSMSLTATAVAPDDSLLASNYCVPPNVGVWSLFQLNFVATTTNTTLVFKDTSLNTIAVDLVFDDVTVTGVPPTVPPTVATSPASQTVNAGDSVVLTASAGGDASSAQWYRINWQGTNAIAGATSNTLNLTAGNTTPGGYFAVFSNTGGIATTSVANLAVLGLSFTNGSFENVNDTTIPYGSAVYIYPGGNWLTGWTVSGPEGVKVAVANGPSDALAPYDGQQWITFNDDNSPVGAILTQTFTTVLGTPYQVSFAVSQNEPGNMSLTATAIGSINTIIASNYCVPAKVGVWSLFQLNFIAVSTNTTLVFLDSSSQTIGVDLAFDDVTLLSLSTSGPPVVNTSPVSQTVNSGAAVSFSASAAGSPSTIQWYLGTNPITGTGGSASPLTVTASDATAGSYSAVFSNSYGTATTAVAVLTVVDPPVIATSPASIVVAANTEVTLTASATGNPSSVQWYFGTSAISGATSTNLTFMAETAATGDYFAIFSNAAGTATSAVANVIVNAGPFTNGSFELLNNVAALSPGGSAIIAPGNTWLTGWTVSGTNGPDIYVMNATMLNIAGGIGPYDGQQWIDFNGGDTRPGGILSQTFLTTVGQACAVSFAVQIPGSGSGDMSITATAVGSNNAVIASNYCVPPTRATTTSDWYLYQLNFTANSTNTTLVFKDTSDATSAVDIALDDVTLVFAPLIVTSPVSQTNIIGTPVTFTASASGSPATVQWFQGATPILNATNTTLSFTVNSGSAGNYTAVFTNSAGSATTAAAVLTLDLPASLTQQPQSVTTNVGATVTFTGGASGTAPLSLQWQLNGTNISGATNASLVLTNVQPTDVGSYALIVANAFGTNTSTPVGLTLISALQIVSGTVPSVGTVSTPVTSVPVTVTVNLLATGTENGLIFNVGYSPSLLTYTGWTPGSGASGASCSVTCSQAGQIGVFVGLDTGATFAAGTQQVVQLTFQAILVPTNAATPIGFTNSPYPTGLSDVNGVDLPASFLAGSLAIPATPLEGHVALSGNEGYAVGITDWVQEGRFAAGLDLDYILTNAAEFQQADSAPRATLGDGAIDVSDWVQVGRYALGLDPPTAAGGLTSAPAQSGSVKAIKSSGAKPTPKTGLPRPISMVPLTQGAATNLVAVQMTCQGGESSLQFGISFDPTALAFVSATAGSGANGARLIFNANNLADGQLSIVVGLMPPMTFASGTHQLVNLAFRSISYSNTTSVAFADAPIGRRLVDANANTLSATYQGTSFPIAGQSWPLVTINQTGSNVVLSWPFSPTVLAAQWSTNLGTNWYNTGGTPVTSGNTTALTLPVPANGTVFRLHQP